MREESALQVRTETGVESGPGVRTGIKEVVQEVLIRINAIEVEVLSERIWIDGPGLALVVITNPKDAIGNNENQSKSVKIKK